MAIPSRVFVGILVFGLLASFAIIPYTILVLSGYDPPAEAPYQNLFPQPEQPNGGTSLVLVLASLFCLAVVVTAWRGLLHGARLDKRLRAERAQRPREEDPPGYQ